MLQSDIRPLGIAANRYDAQFVKKVIIPGCYFYSEGYMPIS